jgi:acetolactate synthase-1/2/3 large subunit
MMRKPAATVLHLGPGLGNSLSNLHNARKAGSPVINVVGEHSTQHLRYDAPLTTDVRAFARTVSHWVHYLERATDIGNAATQAVRMAVTPPGQIATLIVPADLSSSDAGAPGTPVPPPRPPAPSGEAVSAAGRILRCGEPVAIMLSGGALLEQGLDAAARIRESTGCRVFASRFAARIARGSGRFAPERIPYFPEAAVQLLAGLKHMVLVEARPPVSFFGYPGKPSYLAPADCAMHVLAGGHDDGTAGLEALAAECGARSVHKHASSASLAPVPHGGKLTPEVVGRAVATLLPEGAIVSEEAISSSEPLWPALRAAAPHEHLPVSGGSIGQCLPVAVGAAVACPGRKVVALEADGSGMYTLQALWTMARERLDVVTVVFANRRYRILQIEMARSGGPAIGPLASGMIDLDRPNLDWVKLAEGHGVEACRATSAGEFVAQFAAAMKGVGPRLIEAVLE